MANSNIVLKSIFEENQFQAPFKIWKHVSEAYNWKDTNKSRQNSVANKIL